MLYERWQQTALTGGERMALRDLVSGKAWTFKQLAASIEKEPVSLEPVAFPQGNSSDFIFSVLRAWRGNQVVCGLETDQSVPMLSGKLPAGIKHLKATSATTGPQRLVAFKPEQLIADARNIVLTMGLRCDWPNLGVISLSHSYGFSNLVLPLLLHAIPLVLVGSGLPEAVRRAATLEREITLASVPALWGKWHDTGSIPGNIRLAISAGAPLPLILEQAIYTANGLKVHNFYGSTECGGIAYDATTIPRINASGVGAPMQNVNVSVNESGCLEVRGEAVGETYWPEPHPNLSNGVFKSSDLAEIHGGMVYLSGRLGDQINVAGRKVLPEAIERVLASHPDVRECLAFGVPSDDDQRGETIVACLAAKPDIDLEILRHYALNQLPSWQVPRKWWVVDSLSANVRGKISRAEWRKRYLEAFAEEKKK